MRQIVLTLDQRDLFNSVKNGFKDSFNKKGVDFIPIEIKNNLFILPVDVLTDDDFSGLKTALENNDMNLNLLIREVDATEYLPINDPLQH